MGRLLLIIGFYLSSTNLLFGQGSYLNIMGIIRGDSLGSQFGKKVVSAGDVNGDSVPDFLVLATGDQKVYLFHGKKGGLDTVLDMVFEQKDRLELLGDINADGCFDFSMRPKTQFKRLSIYFGGASLDTVTDGSVVCDSFVGPFWFNVSGGKLSGIGNGQIVVGFAYVGYDSTRFYVFNVALDSIDSLARWKIDVAYKHGSEPPGPALVLGDINGDGFEDLAIGRPAGTGYLDSEVEIYLGGPSFDTIPDIILRPPAYIGLDASYFGRKLASVSDLNGDGYSDFIIGISRTPLLYFGGLPLDTLPQFKLDRLGDNFVNGGDINGDGYNDLLVGRDDHPLTGYAYVYYGGPTMDSIVDLFINEIDLPAPAEGFGQTVAGLGDIDGDGSNDFAVGSTSNTNPDRGYLWIFKGLLPSTGVNDENKNLPMDFELGQNYPNPFNSSTLISYTLSRRARVLLEIFNIAGQLVKDLVDAEQSAGSHQISWEGKDSKGRAMPSGIYLYKLSFEGDVQVKKMVLVK